MKADKQHQNPFSIIPYQVFMDDRLTHTDLRVIGAILSWRDISTGICCPSKEQIAERCGLPLRFISCSMVRLESLGWIEKSRDNNIQFKMGYQHE